ncbi:MAG: type IV secretion system DNA-binding domain-containing protein [Acidimicrobiales bacterium]
MSRIISYRLSFPRSTKPEQLTAVWAGIASALSTTLWIDRPWVIAEVVAHEGRLNHVLHVPSDVAPSVSQQLSALAPAVRWQPIETEQLQVDQAIELRLSALERPLRTDRATAVSSAVLMAVAAADSTETVILQWVLAGARPPRAIHHSKSPLLARADFGSDVRVETGDPAVESRAKLDEPLLLGICRVGVSAEPGSRRRQLLADVVGAMRGSDAPSVRTVVRWFPSWLSRSRMQRRLVPMLWPNAFNAAELAGRIGWPIGGVQVPGLRLVSSRLLVPSTALSSDASEGVVLARTTFPGVDQPIVLRDCDRLEHLHLMGSTGVGKTTVLARIALQDAEHGHTLIVIDPKGDLVEDILARLPENRLNDVILLDPADHARPVGFNPLAVGVGESERDLDLVVDSIASVFRGLFSQHWGPRTDDILRAGLLTLGQAPVDPELAYTLCELPALLTHQGFRRTLTARLEDPIALEPFWAVYESLRPSDRANVIAPLQNKLRAFLLRKSLRAMMGQSRPGWSIEQVMAERKILLVPLRAGQIGEEAAQLFGSLVVARIWQATLARSRIAPADRHPVMVLIDEFHTLINVPTSLGDLLAQARGLGVSMTLAHQHLGQLSPELRRDLANTRSRVLFQLAMEDARFFARGLPELEAEDLQDLPSREVVMSLVSNAEVQPAVTGRTLPLEKSVRDPAEVAEQSRSRHGVPAGEVEAALRSRLPKPTTSSRSRTRKQARKGQAASEQQGELAIGDLPKKGASDE